MAGNINSCEHYSGNGFTYGQVYEAGMNLIADLRRVKPRNIAQLNNDQIEVLLQYADMAEAISVDAMREYLRVVGFTHLNEQRRERETIISNIEA